MTAHWDGATWTVVQSPAQKCFFNRLYGVVSLYDTEAWAVGTHWSPRGMPSIPSSSAGTVPPGLRSVPAASNCSSGLIHSPIQSAGATSPWPEDTMIRTVKVALHNVTPLTSSPYETGNESPSPSCPRKLSPQHHAVRSARVARVWWKLARTLARSVSAQTWVGVFRGC